MRTWIEKVGPSSSYWCTISFFTRVSEIYKTPLDNCKDQFKFGSCLDEDTNGVMEILFAASCFMSPRLVNMGSLFWVFTREIIRVNVSSVDQLNSLLWNQLLPQTILALEPIVYCLDCLLPGIDIVLSIEGIPQAPHGKLAPSTDKKRPVIMIPSNSSLVFYNNARLSCLDIQRIEVPHAQRQDNALTFKAVRGDRREVRLADICVTGGGIRIEKYDFVRCACISVTGATVGLTIRNVRDFYFGGGRRSSHGHFIDPKIEQCGIAIAIKPACRVICEEVSVSDCGTVFSVSVSDDFLVKRATLQRCGSMGEVFMTPGLRPVFFETMVWIFFNIQWQRFLTCFCCSLGIFPWVLRKRARTADSSRPRPYTAAVGQLYQAPLKNDEMFQVTGPSRSVSSLIFRSWCSVLVVSVLFAFFGCMGGASDFLVSQMRNQQMRMGANRGTISDGVMSLEDASCKK